MSEKLPKQKQVNVLKIDIRRKTNGWFVIATFEGGMQWDRELVFESKEGLLKWLDEHLPKVEIFYKEDRKYYDLKEVQ